MLSWVVAIVGDRGLLRLPLGQTKPVRTTAPAVEPESRPPRTTSPVPVEEEDATYPRSAFLSAATLGLGAVIGGVITVPVLGFAVLPSFTNQHDQEVDLGPIENFPENEFVIATYLEDPKVGEVTRRTMYIRNNGQLDGKPSFTTIYSRCAHLGCPVQPNGPIEEDKKTTYGDHVDLIPVLAVGFGCPCHGGQYDTEGNRKSGPPVRALDRAQFSIPRQPRPQHVTASPMSRARATARIKAMAAFPGVHVDGVGLGSTRSRYR